MININMDQEEFTMKKKLAALTLCMCAGLATTACGGAGETADVQQTQEETQAEETTASDAEQEAAEAEGQETEQSESESGTEADGAETSTGEEAAAEADPKVMAFANQVKEAVAAKDLDALSALIAYPVYVGIEEGAVIENADALAELGAEAVFDESLVSAIDAFDNATLVEVGAGYVMGDGKPNIIFDRQEDGSFGITGINY